MPGENFELKNASLERLGTTEKKNAEVKTTSVVSGEATYSAGITPSLVEIPAINVSAEVESLGLTESGAMDVPETGDTVGWFHGGTKPGARGNAVMAGHVDDYEGPAIFFELKSLSIGDEVIIYEGDKKLVFEVTRMESYPYNDAPLQEIFGYTNEQRLNLITCTGEFDREQGTHQERLVVYTQLKNS